MPRLAPATRAVFPWSEKGDGVDMKSLVYIGGAYPGERGSGERGDWERGVCYDGPSMRNLSIAVIPGDGIGQEVIPPALDVLRAAGAKFGLHFEFAHFDWGA